MLLTGCTGWLGQTIVPYFASYYDCDVLSRNPGTNLTGDARTVMLPDKYDYVIHGAMDGAQNIIDQVGDARVLFLSSGAAHYRQDKYGDVKRRDEAILQDRAVIARLFSFIGPNMPQHYAAGEFLACLRSGRNITVTGDGRTVRSYMHVDDLPVALHRLMDWSPRTVDVGSPERVTILELAQRIAAYGALKVYTSEHLVNPVDHYVPDTEFSCTDLSTAIRRSI